MTRTHFAVILLAVLLGGCIFVSRSITKHADAVTDMIRSAEANARSGDYQAAEGDCHRAAKYWKRHNLLLAAFLQHDEPDLIETSIAQLIAYAQQEDDDEFLALCAGVLCQLEHLKSMETPTLQNIL